MTIAARDERRLTQGVGCHVYGVVRSDTVDVLPDVTGIDDAPRLVVQGGVAAVVSDLRIDRPPGRRADLMAYSRVLDTLARRATVVPVQFGSVLDQEDEVVDQTSRPPTRSTSPLCSTSWRGGRSFCCGPPTSRTSALSEVVASDVGSGSCASVTVGRPEAVHRHLVHLGELVSQALEEKREVDCAMILEFVGPLVAAHRVRIGSGTDELCELSVLVDDVARDRFEERLEILAEAVHERIRLRLLGPLAPFDFVGPA